MKKYWIIVLIAILLVTGFALIVLTSYLVAYRSLGEEISQYSLPLTTDNIYSDIQKDFILPIYISSIMANDTFLRDWVLSGEEDADRIIRYLAEIQNKYNTVTSFFVSSNTKNYYHPDGILKQVRENDPDDAWYFRASKLDELYEINIDSDTAERKRITVFVNYQVHDYKNNLIGVTGVGLELKQMQKAIEKYQSKYKSIVFFADSMGKVRLHAENFEFPLDLYKWKGFSSLALKLLSNPGISFDYINEDYTYFLNSRPVPEFNLILIILKKGDTLKENLKEKLRINLVISFLISLIILGIVIFIVRRYNQKLELMAYVDTLTDSYNRNAFQLIFSQLSKEEKRLKRKSSLLLLDLDHFKSINDKYGHNCGDLVLKSFSELVLKIIRETDVFCRWGGEEFVLLLVDCSMDKAVEVAEKIRIAVSELEIPFWRDIIKVTVSIGVVERLEKENLSQLINRADRMMYLAKEQGRNQVFFDKSKIDLN
ncbi:MAG: diguanylate cyclase [Deltaproteobacteria bacterium]|nr:diguanylate cyclase [Deltaproteobacteria bacterium]